MIQDFIDFLDTAQFRVPDEEFFRTLWPTIVEIIRNPTSNVLAATLIVAIACVLLLMIGFSITYFLLGMKDEEEEVELLVQQDGSVTTEAVPVVAKAKWVDDPLRHHKRFLWVIGLALLLLVTTGITTQNRSVCMSCHVETDHVKETEGDPHKDVACVRCHEGGDVVASVTISVVPRVWHIAQGIARSDSMVSYGNASSRACMSCHAGVTDAVTENSERALRMSHKEPIEAGAVCLDCHQLDAQGQVTRVTQGMDPCLRCHNDEVAAAACTTCHTGDVSKAIVARRSMSDPEPKQLVTSPDCYSCHDPAPCDSCHGVRLPHPENYVTSHMRDAAIELWDNNGEACLKCHASEQRSCYRAGCHEFEMPLHSEDGSWRVDHQREPEGACEGCHNKMNQFPNTCAMCHPERAQ